MPSDDRRLLLWYGTPFSWAMLARLSPYQVIPCHHLSEHFRQPVMFPIGIHKFDMLNHTRCFDRFINDESVLLNGSGYERFLDFLVSRPTTVDPVLPMIINTLIPLIHIGVIRNKWFFKRYPCFLTEL